MRVLSTERLHLRWFVADDAAFIFELVNDPDWVRFIGDRKIHTLEAARTYIENSLIAMCRRLGFGLWLVERRTDGVAIGICGLIKRESLADVDLGFAFLPDFRGQGFAIEAATATLAYGRDHWELKRIVAITSPDNEPSAKVLKKIGMHLEQRTRLAGEERDCLLFAWNESY